MAKVASVENSLFMSLVHNTGNQKSTKALKPLTAGISRQPSDLPKVTENTSLFEPTAHEPRIPSISLFFEDGGEGDRDEKTVERPNSLNNSNEATSQGVDESTNTIRATPSFEDLTMPQPCDGTLMENCNDGDSLANRRYSEAKRPPFVVKS